MVRKSNPGGGDIFRTRSDRPCGRSERMSKSSWMMDPTRSREMPNCSAIDLAEIRRSSKISSWIWSIISGVVTVLGRPGRGASQVEKSPRLSWATQFLTVAYDGACSSNVSLRMAWISFDVLPCRGGGTWWQLASPRCWNRARRLTCFLSASVTRKDLQFGTWTGPSFQRHYRFRPTSGSRPGYGLISTPSYRIHYIMSALYAFRSLVNIYENKAQLNLRK